MSVACSHYRKGQPDREIVRLAEELDAGLIVRGGRDRGKINQAMVNIFPYFRAFPDKVFHRASCSVLVVRGEEARKYSG